MPGAERCQGASGIRVYAAVDARLQLPMNPKTGIATFCVYALTGGVAACAVSGHIVTMRSPRWQKSASGCMTAVDCARQMPGRVADGRTRTALTQQFGESRARMAVRQPWRAAEASGAQPYAARRRSVATKKRAVRAEAVCPRAVAVREPICGLRVSSAPPEPRQFPRSTARARPRPPCGGWRCDSTAKAQNSREKAEKHDARTPMPG